MIEWKGDSLSAASSESWRNTSGTEKSTGRRKKNETLDEKTGSYLGGRSVEALIQTWSWIQWLREEESGLQEGEEGERRGAAVGRVKELVVGASHQTAPCSCSPSLCGPCGCQEGGGRREEGRGQPLVYLPPVLFTLSGLNPLVEQRGGGQKKKKERRGQREKVAERERGDEANRIAPPAEEGRVTVCSCHLSLRRESLRESWEGGWQEG